MRIRLITIWMFLIALISCKHQVVTTFELLNNSGINIDSLKIEPNIDDVKKYISLKPNEKLTYIADMTGIPKNDGCYRISFKQNGKIKTQNVGYYINGYPNKKLIKIEIDTLKIHF